MYFSQGKYFKILLLQIFVLFMYMVKDKDKQFFLRINNLFGTHEINKHDQNQSVNSTSRVLVSLKLLAAH